MKEYTKTNPVYSPKIKVVETTDPAHADNVNAAPKQLLENTMANRQSIERLEATTGIAEGDYNAGNAYHTGDFCLYDNNLYKCIKDTTGAWDAGSWKETSPLEEIESLRKSLDALDTLMGGATQSKEGTAGLVPAPAAGAHGKYLRGDATWENMDEHQADFTVPNNRSNISAGDKIKIIFGKIAKVFSDMGAAAYYALANNLATTEPGFALDAQVGPVIDQRFTEMETQIEELNSALGAMSNIETVFMNTEPYTDANLLPISSYAYVFSTAKNIPANTNNGSLIFTGGISDRKFQLCFDTNNKLHTRVISSAQGVFTDWVER